MVPENIVKLLFLANVIVHQPLHSYSMEENYHTHIKNNQKLGNSTLLASDNIMNLNKILNIEENNLNWSSTRLSEDEVFHDNRFNISNTILKNEESKIYEITVNKSEESVEVALNPIKKEVKINSSENIVFEERAREDAYNRSEPEENPYSVLLLSMNGDKPQGVCTGSLLTDEWVLTAAHCLYNEEKRYEKVLIYAGGNSIQEVLSDKSPTGSQTLLSTEVYPHPKYKVSKKSFDVAVIKAARKFNLTKTVNTIKLSSQPWTDIGYVNCVFTGFGIVQMDEKNIEDKTRKTQKLQVKTPCKCSFRLKVLAGSRSAKRYLCTKPKIDYGVCPGDSGGGLVCNGEIKGVAMQIIALLNMDTCDIGFTNLQCGSKNTLSVFQNTCPFLQWINLHVKIFKASEISPKCTENDLGVRIHKASSCIIIIVAALNVLFLI